MQILWTIEGLKDAVLDHPSVQLMDAHERQTLANKLAGMTDEQLRAEAAKLDE